TLRHPHSFPTRRSSDLIAPNGMPGAPYMKGFNNPRYHEEVIARTKKMIDACADAGCPSVIAFTGYRWRDADDPRSGAMGRDEGRSEEHTSELQSPYDLV